MDRGSSQDFLLFSRPSWENCSLHSITPKNFQARLSNEIALLNVSSTIILSLLSSEIWVVAMLALVLNNRPWTVFMHYNCYITHLGSLIKWKISYALYLFLINSQRHFILIVKLFKLCFNITINVSSINKASFNTV